jgi:hypothetical protein
MDASEILPSFGRLNDKTFLKDEESIILIACRIDIGKLCGRESKRTLGYFQYAL